MLAAHGGGAVMTALAKWDLAGQLIEFLSPACQQISVAGSLRRGETHIKDVDLICEPIFDSIPDLFGQQHVISSSGRLTDALELLPGQFNLRRVRGGDRLVTFRSNALGCSVDLFIVRPPAQWGALLAIRTGPQDFSNLCVTSRFEGGALSPVMVQLDGYLSVGGRTLLTPTEAAWFEAIGVPCWEPGERSVKRLRSFLNAQRKRRSR